MDNCKLSDSIFISTYNNGFIDFTIMENSIISH